MQVFSVRGEIQQARQHLPLLRRPRDRGHRADFVGRVILGGELAELDDGAIVLKDSMTAPSE
jgi:hypothetical protein